MKAAWYEKQGPPRKVLVVGEMPDPIPAAGEVRIRIADVILWAKIPCGETIYASVHRRSPAPTADDPEPSLQCFEIRWVFGQLREYVHLDSTQQRFRSPES